MEPALRARLLVADERRLCRENLRQALASEESIDVVGEAADWRQAIDTAGKLRPDVALISTSLPGMSWVEGVRHLGTQAPSTEAILCCPRDQTLID